jgi:hypothetical protein
MTRFDVFENPIAVAGGVSARRSARCRTSYVLVVPSLTAIAAADDIVAALDYLFLGV